MAVMAARQLRPVRGTRRNDTPGVGATRPLDLYFQHLANTKRLAAGDEFALALELRASRRSLWETLLTGPMTDVLDFAFVRLGAAARPKALERRYLRALAQPGGQTEDAVVAIREELAAAVAVADRDGVAARALAHDWKESPQVDHVLRRRAEAAAARVAMIRDRFVAANLGLVVVLARRYEQRHFSLADLIQEGNTGLLKAVDRFDPERGFRFSTYAVWWIRHALGRALSDKSREIRLPVHVAERQQTVLRCKGQFEGRHGRAPTMQELSGLAKLPEAKVVDLLSVEYTRATGTARGTGERTSLEVDDLAGPREFEPEDLDTPRFTKLLRRTIRTLPNIERDVLRQRYGLDGDEPRTLREVGETHDLSRERIRQLQVRALGNLRRAFTHLRAS